MPTFYKPTQYRGKRVIFTSQDPNERKRQNAIAWIAIALFFAMPLLVWLVSRL